MRRGGEEKSRGNRGEEKGEEEIEKREGEEGSGRKREEEETSEEKVEGKNGKKRSERKSREEHRGRKKAELKELGRKAGRGREGKWENLMKRIRTPATVREHNLGAVFE